MIITVNGSPIEFEGSLAELIDTQQVTRGIAVAVNDEVVARGAWDAHRVAPGDRIEIVTAVQGG